LTGAYTILDKGMAVRAIIKLKGSVAGLSLYLAEEIGQNPLAHTCLVFPIAILQNPLYYDSVPHEF
jgi:hypothetical protein